MNSFIALLLLQDGLTSGAIYALLALVLVMVFSVTRVVLIPQGEIVSYAALTLAALQSRHVPGTILLLGAGGLVAAAMQVAQWLREERRPGLLVAAALYAAVPLAVALAAWRLAPRELPLGVQLLLTVLIVAPLGPLMYRIVFAPIASASVLVLLIVAVAVHFVMSGLGLLFFGPEGVRTPPLVTARFSVSGILVSGQALAVVGIAVLLIVALVAFFGLTLQGKALRATTFNRIGARLVGIDTVQAGLLAFLLAALIGVVSGILVSSITTIYYDTGFLIGLKGFVAAIVGGLVSYPIAALGALALGMLETFSSFWASAFKEVIVFALIIPILLWRSLTQPHLEEEEEE
jgi:branched-chain amino acid transport system permease protein